MKSELQIKISPQKNKPCFIFSFTLVELLVVIAIIAILIAILMPALSGAKTTARKQVAGTNINGLKMGLKAFFNEYGNWPTKADGTVPTDYLTAAELDGLYHILIGENRYLDSTSAGCNARKTAFIDIKSSDLKAVNTTLANGVYPYLTTGTATNYVDPWNNSYMVRFDDNGNNLTETYGASAGNLTIANDLAVWSAGPDGKVDSTETDPVNPTKTNNKDNVTSWK